MSPPHLFFLLSPRLIVFLWLQLFLISVTAVKGNVYLVVTSPLQTFFLFCCVFIFCSPIWRAGPKTWVSPSCLLTILWPLRLPSQGPWRSVSMPTAGLWETTTYWVHYIVKLRPCPHVFVFLFCLVNVAFSTRFGLSFHVEDFQKTAVCICTGKQQFFPLTPSFLCKACLCDLIS